jgi:hypothetical protein
MLLHDSRREARLGPDGEVVLLQEQDRSRWDQEQIREGRALAEQALREAGPAPYPVQAAIAALHAEARRPEDTDWRQIAGLYDVLLDLHSSPVVELNRAVAVAQAYGPEAGLSLLDDLDARGELPAYHLLPAARADLLRNLGRFEESAAAYRRSLTLVANEPERRFLEPLAAWSRPEIVESEERSLSKSSGWYDKVSYRALMPTTKVAITLDEELLERITGWLLPSGGFQVAARDSTRGEARSIGSPPSPDPGVCKAVRPTSNSLPSRAHPTISSHGPSIGGRSLGGARPGKGSGAGRAASRARDQS